MCPESGKYALGCRQAVRHQTLTLAFVGSNPAIPASAAWFGMNPAANDPLAQPAEQLPFKQWVRSSNLRRVTKKEDHRWWSSFLLPAEEIRKIKSQLSGGQLLPPVQKLVATFIFFRHSERRCKRISGGSLSHLSNLQMLIAGGVLLSCTEQESNQRSRLGEALTVKPIGTSPVSFLSYPAFKPSSPRPLPAPVGSCFQIVFKDYWQKCKRIDRGSCSLSGS